MNNNQQIISGKPKSLGKLAALVFNAKPGFILILGLMLTLSSLQKIAKADEHGQTLLVFAASSLAPVLEEIKTSFEEETGYQVSFSFASSAILARQISARAPAHIFISADEKWLNWLRQESDLALPSTPVIGNQIILASRQAKQTIALSDNMDATISLMQQNHAIAMADPQTVPLGRYSEEALLSLGLKEIFAPHTIHANSAQATVRFLNSDAVSMAIIYKSDLVQNHGLHQVFAFPVSSHTPIIYHAATTLTQPQQATLEFMTYLKSTQAQAIFSNHGFRSILDSAESEPIS